ncbi:MAG: DNA gyrase subunit A [Nitrospinota bacterium]|jgi:DNA gyrase subunit A|nr:DNA gyrase subunit A [Nitrospinota bacterium]
MDNLQSVNIEEEMSTSFMDYAMSVIIARALPDVRDGLKPVHRRILVTLNDLGLNHTKAYRKCAKIAGDVSGNYHPHGEAVVYPALARMAQDFSMRGVLVDGQGNFGSVDGDPPAAMRYTEARMTEIAENILTDIEKETVDFVDNYDNTRREPSVLPSRIPNLLLNGSTGIAVGMATNIPPHNLGELCDALLLVLKNPNVKFDKLVKTLPGPDFPTAGIIYGRKGIRDYYETGRGHLQLRARALLEIDDRTGRQRIVISEIPYTANKARLIEKIADLVRAGRVKEVSDIRDESDRNGMRIVVELKRDAVGGAVLNRLYKHTQMQITFSVIMIALLNNQPRVMPIGDMMSHFLRFRREILLRRTRFDLRKAEERAHILEGYRIALDKIDAVIKLIRGSKTADVARQGLMTKFGLTQIQAQAILEMRLQRLTGLERDKIESEYKELRKAIRHFRRILVDEKIQTGILQDEIGEVKKKFADERRTEIVDESGDIAPEDMIVEEDMAVTISNSGYIKRNAISLYRSQRRGGKGVVGMNTKEEDFVEHLFIASTHDYLLFFSNNGRCYWLKVHEVPQAGRAARGKAVVNVLNLSSGEKITAVLPVRKFEPDRYVFMATKNGTIKKTELTAFSRPRAGGIIALGLDAGDELIGVGQTDGSREIFIGTQLGKAVRFPEAAVRPMGRTARGVRGIGLAKGDSVVGMEIVSSGDTILTATELGFGKRSLIDDYRTTNRGGKGVINLKVTPKNGKVIGVRRVSEEDEFMLITTGGLMIRARVRDVSVIGRSTQGVRLIGTKGADRVAALGRIEENGSS